MTLLPQSALILLAALPRAYQLPPPNEPPPKCWLQDGRNLSLGTTRIITMRRQARRRGTSLRHPQQALLQPFAPLTHTKIVFDNTHPPPQDHRCRRDGRSSKTRRTGCRTISMRAQEKFSGSALPPMRPPPHRPCLPQCRLQRRQARNRRRPITVLHRRRRPTAPVLDLARLRCIVRRCMPTALFPSRPRRRIIKSVSSACRRLRARTSR